MPCLGAPEQAQEDGQARRVHVVHPLEVEDQLDAPRLEHARADGEEPLGVLEVEVTSDEDPVSALSVLLVDQEE